jgi:putative transposase
MKKKHTENIELDTYYHIYNRGINGEDFFKSEANFSFFLDRLSKFVLPIARIYAYVLELL